MSFSKHFFLPGTEKVSIFRRKDSQSIKRNMILENAMEIALTELSLL